VCDTYNIRLPEARQLKGLDERLGVIDQALVSPAQAQRRGEYAMTATFELLYQKLPALGPLSTAMKETVGTHCCMPSRAIHV